MKIGEDTNVTLDLKTVGIIIGGAIAIATTYITLSSSVAANSENIETIKDNAVNPVEFQYKDQLVRESVLRLEEKQDIMGEDVKEVKDQLQKIDERLYQISKNQ